jgi:hypothetical protein
MTCLQKNYAAHAQRQRKKVEALFAELKNQIGLRRMRLRRMNFVREQFFMAAVAQNIKRLVRFLSQSTTLLCQPPLSRTDRRKNSQAKWSQPKSPPRSPIRVVAGPTSLCHQPQAFTLTIRRGRRYL